MKPLRLLRAAALISFAALFSGCGSRDGSSLVAPPASGDKTVASVALVVVQTGQRAATLSWSSSDSAKMVYGFRVYRDGAQLAVTARSPWVDTTLTAMKTYSYRIVSLDAKSNEDVWSNTATLQLISVDAIPTTMEVPKIMLTPPTAVVTVGDSVKVTAVVLDSVSGARMDTATVAWASSNPGIATTKSGWVYGKSVGQVVVTATSGTGVASATVIVMPKSSGNDTTPSSMTIYPNPITLPAGATVDAQAIIQTNSGAVLSGRSITWTTANDAIAAVSATGRVTGMNAGTTTITATSGSLSATVSVTVTPVASTPTTPSNPSTPSNPTNPTTPTTPTTPSNPTNPTNPTSPAAPTVASVSVTPSSSAMTIGATAQLVAQARDAQGAAMSASVVWTSSNTSVATVSSTGVVTAVAAGTATIVATSGSISGSASVVVSAPAAPPAPVVVSVSVTPSTASINVGTTVHLSATPLDILGNVLANVVTFSSSSSAVATVAANGTVTGVAAGTATITATVGGVSATATITVTSPVTVPAGVASVVVTPATASVAAGFTQQYAAQTRDAQGNVLTGQTVTWTSSNNAVATVSASGLVTGVGAGTATIAATSGSVSGTATVTVTAASPPIVASVVVTPATAGINVGATAQLTATPKDLLGNVLSGAVTWTSGNNAIASVSANGLVTGVAPGTATITATVGGVSATATITVTALPAPVASVVVTPSSASITVGNTTQLAATPRDASNTALAGRAVTWASSNASVATVSASGLVTAVAAGSATITATSEGVNGTASITVTVPAPTIVSVRVTPSTGSLNIGSTIQLGASPLDLLGNILSGTATWSSSNNAIATLSANGTVTGIAAGTVTINATIAGITGSATITVNAPAAPPAPPAPAPIATIAVSPSTASIAALSSTQLSATPRDAQGNALTGRTLVWTSSNPLVATVTQSGLVTGVTTGSVTISVTGEGITGTASVSITPIPVSTVTISTGSVCVAGSLQLSAVAKDAHGNVLTGRVVTWSSSSPLVASVSASGLVAGLALGSTTITATIDGVSASTTLTLCPAVVASVSISGNTGPLSLLANLLMPLTATAKDANGNVIAGKTATWSVTPAVKALISVNGLLTPLGLGTVTVTATIDGVSTTTSVSIVP